MKWNNEAKISETLIERLPASSYKKDIKFDFENKNLGPEMVQGLEAFIQKFKKVLLTKNNKHFTYGLAEFLPHSSDQEEFNKQCEKLSYEILNHQFSDSEPGNPNGLGYTVNKVYSIELNETGQKYTFVIGAEGELETLEITFPTLAAIAK